MSIYSRLMFPHIMETLSKGPETAEQRRLTLARARGEVLEIGFGTGHNFPHYPKSVNHLTALDRERMLPHKVEQRIARAGVPVTRVHLDASRGLPFPDNSFDTVVTTWTLCSISNVVAALMEIGRVLRPDGSYLFLEHGRSEDPRVARRQDLFSPMIRIIGAGCRMNRRIDQLVLQARLQLVTLDRFQMPETPRILGEMYRGVAMPPDM